ncbi:hypothetical protein V8B97DRAFT_1916475 [Scleroderma yunnanense]
MLHITKEFKDLLNWVINMRYVLHFNDLLLVLTGTSWVSEGNIGHHTSRTMTVILLLGVIAIHSLEIFTESQSIILMICLVMISIMLGDILAVALYIFSMEPEQNEIESALLPEQISWHGGHFTSAQAWLQSILAVMHTTTLSIVVKSAVLVPFLEPVCMATTLVVTPAVRFLEWFICAAYH